MNTWPNPVPWYLVSVFYNYLVNGYVIWLFLKVLHPQFLIFCLILGNVFVHHIVEDSIACFLRLLFNLDILHKVHHDWIFTVTTHAKWWDFLIINDALFQDIVPVNLGEEYICACREKSFKKCWLIARECSFYYLLDLTLTYVVIPEN
jgi:hypothetical protein